MNAKHVWLGLLALFALVAGAALLLMRHGQVLEASRPEIEAAAPAATDALGARTASHPQPQGPAPKRHLEVPSAEWEAEAEQARFMGHLLAPGETLAVYFAELERRVSGGDPAAMVLLAHLLRECKLSADAIRNPDSGLYESAKLCARLPERDIDYPSRLVAEAAALGDEEAIYAEAAYPPLAAWSAPDSAAAKEWIEGVVNRLDAAAAQGSAAATHQLAELYSSSVYMPQDLPRAAIYHRRALELAPRRLSTAEIMRLPFAERRRASKDLSNRIRAEHALQTICRHISKDSVPNGVCSF